MTQGRRADDQDSPGLEADQTEEDEPFRAFFEHSLQGAASCRVIYDEQGSPADVLLLRVNPAFVTLTGVEEAQGRRASDLIPGIRQANPELFELLWRVASTGEPERLRTLLETTTDGFWMVDSQGQLLQVNDAYCRRSGYREEELLALRISDLEALESAVDVSGHIQRIIDKGEDSFEALHRREDGSTFRVEINAQHRPIEGGRIMTFLRDVTERRQAEQALRESEDRYRRLAERARTLLGYSPEEAIGLEVERYLAPGSITRLRRLIRRLLATEPPTLHYMAEVDYIHREGHRIPCEINATLVLEDSGAVRSSRGSPATSPSAGSTRKCLAHSSLTHWAAAAQR